MERHFYFHVGDGWRCNLLIGMGYLARGNKEKVGFCDVARAHYVVLVHLSGVALRESDSLPLGV